MHIPNHINFHSSDWAAIRQLLLDKRDTKIKLLISSSSHDQSNQLRGSLMLITELLGLEEAARNKAANRG